MSNSINNQVFVVTHKDFDQSILPAGYSSILAGASFNSASNVDFLDNSGINISDRNKSFCELTAQYWAWKNTSYSIYAFVHYRRFFQAPDPPEKGKSEIIPEKKLFGLLSECDVVLAKPVCSLRTVRDTYGAVHGFSDLDNLRTLIASVCPDYLDPFDKVMNSHSFSPFNMYAMNADHFNQYMEWLFSLLFEFEKQIDIERRDVYNTRVFGFLAERLLNVWINKNNLKVSYLPVLFLGNISFVSRVWEKFKDTLFLQN